MFCYGGYVQRIVKQRGDASVTFVSFEDVLPSTKYPGSDNCNSISVRVAQVLMRALVCYIAFDSGLRAPLRQVRTWGARSIRTLQAVRT